MRTALLLALLCSASAAAQVVEVGGQPIDRAWSERERIALANVGLTSLFTLARGVAEGRVRSVRDGLEVAGWGAVAGAGFYAAKDQVGRGRGALGVGLAFASASLAENAAAGGGVAGHVRVGFGPLDLRLRTPLATRPGPALGVEIDPLGAVALVAVPLSGGQPVVRGGVLMYDHPALDRTGGGNTRTPGTAIGRVVLTEEDPDDLVVRHETIHLIQAVQASAVTPYGTLGSVWRGGRHTARGGAVQWDVRTDWLYGTVGGLDRLLADGPEDGWGEFEAYTLDEAPPSRLPSCLPRPPDVVRG